MITEPELLIIERAFPEAQALLVPVSATLIGRVLVGWHDTSVSRWSGAAAVVRREGPYEYLIGQVIQVSTDDGQAGVYVVGAADVIEEISLARRAFLAVAPLGDETAECVVAVA